MDIIELSAHALSVAIRTRQVSCREVMAATLTRIAAVDPAHNAIVSLRDGDAPLREADERDAQLARGATPAGPIGTMHGMPQAIKDMALTAGIRTTLGSPLLRDFIPTTICGRLGGSLLEVDRVLFQRVERDHGECLLVRRGQHHG